MQRIRGLLRKCTAATLFAVMTVAGIGATILDAHGLGEDPHFEAPQQSACSPYDHNHSLCLFMTASPHVATTPPMFAAQVPPESTLGMPDADLSFADRATGVSRARSPPVV
jgi:hypothetical protein